jgi:malate synthase
MGTGDEHQSQASHLNNNLKRKAGAAQGKQGSVVAMSAEELRLNKQLLKEISKRKKEKMSIGGNGAGAQGQLSTHGLDEGDDGMSHNNYYNN